MHATLVLYMQAYEHSLEMSRIAGICTDYCKHFLEEEPPPCQYN